MALQILINGGLSALGFVLQDYLSYSQSFAFPYKFHNQIVNSHICAHTLYCDFYWNRIGSVGQFGEN